LFVSLNIPNVLGEKPRQQRRGGARSALAGEPVSTMAAKSLCFLFELHNRHESSPVNAAHAKPMNACNNIFSGRHSLFGIKVLCEIM
jgi:hypothetical protein